ncbi:sialic acid-binding Ig-like lectin 14 [Balaenoptera musculus]|uniref:Sialic acid-binding Ig-like lectin 14 n=1 Tax=Balaenoptera musculus TaxID=9771 RepID=A0A8B8VYV1_BALMU|nr:sialic acid-binding Ig-like lectin 14 [Balaenoptera musculus]
MRLRRPRTLAALSPKALKALQNRASALLISESPALRLLCVADSNPPARLGWFRASPGLNATCISSTKILELPGLGAAEGEFTCRAQNPLGSQQVSVSLAVQNELQDRCQESPSCRSRVTEAQRGSWPLVSTLIRGALMGAGFLLAYGLTWFYYTRCGGHEGGRAEPPSFSRRDSREDAEPRRQPWGHHCQLLPGNARLKPSFATTSF